MDGMTQGHEPADSHCIFVDVTEISLTCSLLTRPAEVTLQVDRWIHIMMQQDPAAHRRRCPSLGAQNEP